MIIRDDLVGKAMKECPTVMVYKTWAEAESLYNTGPTFGVYLCGLYFDYLLKKGGLSYWNEIVIIYNYFLFDWLFSLWKNQLCFMIS